MYLMMSFSATSLYEDSKEGPKYKFIGIYYFKEIERLKKGDVFTVTEMMSKRTKSEEIYRSFPRDPNESIQYF